MTEEEFREIVEFHYVGGEGTFNGFETLGYIGNSARNYITDEWVRQAATKLGWDASELSAWMQSKEGRWALEEEPMDARHMYDLMSGCDVQELVEAALEEALEA